MKLIWSLVFVLCASSWLAQVTGEEVTTQEVQQVLRTLLQAVPLGDSDIDKVLKNAPTVPLNDVPEIIDYLEKGGLAAMPLYRLSTTLQTLQYSRDSPQWAADFASILINLDLPPAVIKKFQQEAPSEFPATSAEVKTLLNNAFSISDFDSKDNQMEKVQMLMKWFGSLQQYR